MMRNFLFSLAFGGLSACSSAAEHTNIPPEAGLADAECGNQPYVVKRSDFFGNGTYIIEPQPSVSDVKHICDSTSEDDLDAIKSVCDWAYRKGEPAAGEASTTIGDAYWPEEAAKAMVKKLNWEQSC
jgi:hypothetical protein